MALFIELTTEPSIDVLGLNQGVVDLDKRVRAGLSSVRRPLRGLEVKDDTYAIFRAIRADGTEIPLISSSGPTGRMSYFSNFILQTVQEARMEKHQIIETFGETFVYFFGEAPRFLDVQAILINSHDFNWKAEFLANYEQYLRGSRLTELGACAYLFYDDNIVEGFLLSCQVTDTAENPHICTLQFRMLLVRYNNVSFVGDPQFPIRASVRLPADNVGDLTTALSGEQVDQLIAEGTGIDGTVINGQFVAGIEQIRNTPLRSQISHNRDEWTGEAPALRSDFEEFDNESTTVPVDQLNQALVASLLPYGAGEDLNNPYLQNEAGIGPSFSPGGVGIGFGVGGGAGASFGAGFSFSSGFSAGVSAGVSASASVGGSIGGSVSGGMGANAGLSAGASAGFGASAGVGIGASYSSSAGAGASIAVGGEPSAFSLFALSGTFTEASLGGQLSAIASLGFDSGASASAVAWQSSSASTGIDASLAFG